MIRRVGFGLMTSVSATAESPDHLPWINTIPARWHQPALLVFLLLVVADAVRTWLRLPWPAAWTWLSVAPWALAALTLSIGLARRLPVQNVVAVAALAGLLGFGLEALNAATNIPFGHRQMADRAGAQVLGVAWFQPFLWISLAMAGRGVARLMLRPWRKLSYYGFWVMGTAIVLTLVMALAYEAAGGAGGWWWRENRPGVWAWYGAPLASVFGWLVTTLLIYGFTTPWFLNKQPVKQPTDWHPLVVWEILLMWLTLGNALNGLWIAVGVGLLTGIVAAALAIRGGTW